MKHIEDIKKLHQKISLTKTTEERKKATDAVKNKIKEAMRSGKDLSEISQYLRTRPHNIMQNQDSGTACQSCNNIKGLDKK